MTAKRAERKHLIDLCLASKARRVGRLPVTRKATV
jgi:hypothetical protein